MPASPRPVRPVVSRRRGAALLAAIHEATLEEVAEVGFEALSVERIAARAGAGKASIYTRWSTREEIVLAAVSALDDPLADLRARYTATPAVDIRADLVALLARYAQGLSTPTGYALRALMTQRERHPALYAHVYDLTVRPRQDVMRLLLVKAAAAGQVDADRITPWVIGAGPRLLIAHHMEHGIVTRADIVAVVDEILLPALGSRPLTAGSELPGFA